MAKYQQKTLPTDAKVAAFINAVESERKRADARTLLAMFERVTGEPPVLWGPSIIGFGSYDYTYASGHSGTAPRAGFSPRSASISIYLLCDDCDASTEAKMAELRADLGKHKIGKSCLYVNKLADVDMGVLEQMIAVNRDWMDRTYPR